MRCFFLNVSSYFWFMAFCPKKLTKKMSHSNTCFLQTLSMVSIDSYLCFRSKDANRLVSSTSRSLWRFGFLRRCFVSFTTCWKTGQDRGDRTVPHGDGWRWYLCFEWWHRSTRTLCITKIDRGRCQCALVFEIPKTSGFCHTWKDMVKKYVNIYNYRKNWLVRTPPTNIAPKNREGFQDDLPV